MGHPECRTEGEQFLHQVAGQRHLHLETDGAIGRLALHLVLRGMKRTLPQIGSRECVGLQAETLGLDIAPPISAKAMAEILARVEVGRPTKMRRQELEVFNAVERKVAHGVVGRAVAYNVAPPADGVKTIITVR